MTFPTILAGLTSGCDRGKIFRDAPITDDPYTVPFGQHNLFVDLGAERLLAAERGTEQIAVEVKSFIGKSGIRDLENALGQYLLYRSLIERIDAGRDLLLAVPSRVDIEILSTPVGQVAQEDYGLHILVFDEHERRITRWIK